MEKHAFIGKIDSITKTDKGYDIVHVGYWNAIVKTGELDNESLCIVVEPNTNVRSSLSPFFNSRLGLERRVINGFFINSSAIGIKVLLKEEKGLIFDNKTDFINYIKELDYRKLVDIKVPHSSYNGFPKSSVAEYVEYNKKTIISLKENEIPVTITEWIAGEPIALFRDKISNKIKIHYKGYILNTSNVLIPNTNVNLEQVYDLESKFAVLERINKDYVIYGILPNRLLYNFCNNIVIYNMYDIAENKFLNLDLISLCLNAMNENNITARELDLVPIYNKEVLLNSTEYEDILGAAMNDSIYYPANISKGLVMRVEASKKTLFFKVINPEFVGHYINYELSQI